jgi:hypothetical protein
MPEKPQHVLKMDRVAALCRIEEIRRHSLPHRSAFSIKTAPKDLTLGAVV